MSVLSPKPRAVAGEPTSKVWRYVKLGDLGRWFGGGTPSKVNPQFWNGGDIPWVSPKDMKTPRISDAEDHITREAVENSATNLVNAGSVLVVVRSGILKHTLPIAVTEREVALNQDLKAVTPSKEIRADFLAMALKAFEQEILQTCCKSGTTVQNIEMPVFLRFEIPLPPLDEQREIVAEIEKQFTRLEAGVGALKRVQGNLKRYRAAVLKAACEGKLVPTEAELAKADGRLYETGEQLLQRILTERRKNWTGRGKYKESTTPDTTNLPEIPEGWTWASVDQIASVALGKMLDKAKHQTGNKLRYLRNINVRWGRVDTDDCLEMFFEENEIERFAVCAGDVLVCEGGEPGRAALWDGRDTGMMYQKAIHRVRFFGQFEAKYLVFLLEFLAKTGRLERWFTGSTIKHFTRESFISLPIPLPPLSEQKRIVEEVERRLSVIDEMEATVSANLQRATRLRQSILQKSFIPIK